jgi:hypothetical protein
VASIIVSSLENRKLENISNQEKFSSRKLHLLRYYVHEKIYFIEFSSNNSCISSGFE